MCTELPSPQTPPTFAFSHPLVYAIRVQDRVDALDKFIHHELQPKMSRLRQEHNFIEHQLQRTMSKKNDSVGTSTTLTARTPTPKQKQASRLKQQAWMWKQTSKRQELNRFEPFFELATDLQRISKVLNPKLLRLTVLLQRSQSIAPRKHLAADDSTDVVFDERSSGKNYDRRRQLEQERLSKEYHDAFTENVRVSKSIQMRTDKLRTTQVLSSKNIEDASILSSLMIFGYNYIVCGTCQAKFHKDYMNALVVHAPSECGRNPPVFKNNGSSYICIHCWNSRSREQTAKRKHDTTKRIRSPCTNVLSPIPNDEKDDQNKEKQAQTTPTSEAAIQRNPLQESVRWKMRNTVIKNRMAAATATPDRGSSRVGNSSTTVTVTTAATGTTTDSTTDLDSKIEASNVSITSSAVDQYIDSMSTLDDGLMRIGETLSSCSNLILGEFDDSDVRCDLPPLLHPLPTSDKSARPRNIEKIKLQTNTTSLVDNTSDANSDTDASERSDSSRGFGYSSSSLGSNSILESDPEDSIHSRNDSALKNTRYKMEHAPQFGKTPLKRSNSWNRYESSDSSLCSNSIFSDSTAETSAYSYLSASSSEHFRPKYIKSAMKKKQKKSMPSSTKGGSPTKVRDFPSELLHKKKSVRFRSPLEECKVFNPMADTRSNRDLLDSSAEIMNEIEYFCKWDSFMNAFEEQKSS